MKTDVYNQAGEKTGQMELPQEVFEVAFNGDLVHQVVVSQMANKRQGTAHTKDRSEASGGGRKPWRQKGTGRARHGSIRSPIWRGGGVTFGPRKEKVYKKKVPKKMRRKALFMILSIKAEQKTLLILDEFKLEEAKTKLMVGLIKNLKDKVKEFEKASILIALAKKDDKIIRASRNIPKVKTIEARELNPLDLLSFKCLIMPKKSVEVIKKTFLETKSANK